MDVVDAEKQDGRRASYKSRGLMFAWTVCCFLRLDPFQPAEKRHFHRHQSCEQGWHRGDSKHAWSSRNLGISRMEEVKAASFTVWHALDRLGYVSLGRA